MFFKLFLAGFPVFYRKSGYFLELCTKSLFCLVGKHLLLYILRYLLIFLEEH